MAEKSSVDAKARLQHGAFIGDTIAAGIAKTPEIGDAGEEHIAIRRHHTSRHSIQSPVKPRSKYRRPIRAAIAVRVFDEPYLVGCFLEPLHAAVEFVGPLFVHTEAIVSRLQLKIIFQQKWASSILFCAKIESIFFRHENSIEFIETNCHGRSQFRLSGEQIHRHSCGNSKGRHLLCGGICSVWQILSRARGRQDGRDSKHQQAAAIALFTSQNTPH